MKTNHFAASRRSVLAGAAALGVAAFAAPTAWAPGRLADQAGHARRRLPARRPDRLRRPRAAGRHAERARPAGRHRQQGRRERQHRCGRRDEGGAGWLQAVRRQRLDDDRRARLHDGRHRRHAADDADRRDAAVGAGARGAGFLAGQDLRRLRRAGQDEEQGRQGHRLRHRRRGRAPARHDGAAARAPGQAADEPRALQGQQPGDDRPDRRPARRHVRRHVGPRALHQVGPAAAAAGHEREARARVPRRADRRRGWGSRTSTSSRSSACTARPSCPPTW